LTTFQFPFMLKIDITHCLRTNSKVARSISNIPMIIHMQDVVLSRQLSQLESKCLPDTLNDASRIPFSNHNFLKVCHAKVPSNHNKQEIIPIELTTTAILPSKLYW